MKRQPLDVQFGRMPLFDERSRNFGIRELTKGRVTEPRSYTWRCGTVLDQGAEGSCVGHAWAHELLARPACVPREIADHDFAKKIIYWNAQKIDPWEGGSYPGASVFYEGSSVLAGAKATMMTGYINGYRWAFGLEDLIYGIAYNGPAVLGINWYEEMSYPGKAHLIKAQGRLMGGHAILCNGVNTHLEMFRLHNSWGTGWGDHGECYISFSDMEKLLKEQGEACFAIGRKTQTLIE